MSSFNIKKIAEIKCGFHEKFGIPRQSGLCEKSKAVIVFEPEYRVKEAFRNLEDFSHIWIIWQFSKAIRDEWSPTVRPPRLGGNRRIGVFATRSPFRPNPLGLSCVKLEKIEYDSNLGPILHISGADLLDSTPIFDIKPYIPYADCKPDALSGFTGTVERKVLNVDIPREIQKALPNELCAEISDILAQDPRPAYQDDPNRVYKMEYGNNDIAFIVQNGTAFVKKVQEKEN